MAIAKINYDESGFPKCDKCGKPIFFLHQTEGQYVCGDCFKKYSEGQKFEMVDNFVEYLLEHAVTLDGYDRAAVNRILEDWKKEYADNK